MPSCFSPTFFAKLNASSIVSSRTMVASGSIFIQTSEYDARRSENGVLEVFNILSNPTLIDKNLNHDIQLSAYHGLLSHSDSLDTS